MAGAQLLLEATSGQRAPAHERWAEMIASGETGGCAAVGRTVAMMAHVIRDRAVDDPYAAIRIVLSFRFGSDAAHDAAVERIAESLRGEAFG